MRTMNTKSTLILVALVALVMATSGCMEYTTETEYGEATTDVIDGTTTVDLDYHEDGLHITGKAVYQGDKLLKETSHITGYIDGRYVTGTKVIYGDNEPYYDLVAIFDDYTDGLHITGEVMITGKEPHLKTYYDCNIDGYSEGYPISGSMRGYEADVRCEITVHTPYGDTTDVSYRDMTKG
jgi:hypothetical protein